MLYGLRDIGRNLIGLSSHSDKIRKDEFWAVDDVSFEVKRGEVLGIIGPNGSGKTTLLKMLNGIFWPDKGKITVNGKVGALIEVGAGFHPLLTGRENIYINSAILGMSKKETEEKFNDIVDFAGIGDFIDSPVKYYSSGMFVRLGFAVAVHCEPSILLVDEILAVGDVEFRSKCYNRITELMKNCAVVIVSHSMSQISRISNRCMLLYKGKIECLGEPAKVIQFYLSNIETSFNRQRFGNGKAEIYSICFKDNSGQSIHSIPYGSPLTIVVTFQVHDPEIKHPTLAIGLTDLSNNLVAECSTAHADFILASNHGNKQTVALDIQELTISPGKYYVSAVIYSDNSIEHCDWHQYAWELEVTGKFIAFAPVQLSNLWRYQ